MSVNFKEIVNQGLKREYEVIVPSDVIKKEFDQNMGKLLKSSKLPGFRPGKISVSLIEKIEKGSITQIRERAVETAIRDILDKMIEEINLNPADTPKIELNDPYKNLEKSLPEEDLILTVKFDVIPSISDYDWSDLTIEKYVLELSDEDIQEEISEMIKKYKNFVRNKDAVSKMGDMLKIDFEGRIKNKIISGCKGRDFPAELKEGNLLPEFERELIGKKEGDKLAFDVVLPLRHASMSGKTANFTVEVKEVQQDEKISDIPSLCNKLGYKDEEALKENVKMFLQREREQASRKLEEKQVVEAVKKNFDFDLPDIILDNISKSTEESAKENQEEKLDKVRLSMVLNKVSGDNGITVVSEDIKLFIAGQAMNTGTDFKQLAELYKKNPNSVAETKNLLLERKVFSFIISKANKVEKKINYKELKSLK